MQFRPSLVTCKRLKLANTSKNTTDLEKRSNLIVLASKQRGKDIISIEIWKMLPSSKRTLKWNDNRSIKEEWYKPNMLHVLHLNANRQSKQENEITKSGSF